MSPATKQRFTPAYPAELRERGIRMFRANRGDYSSDTVATVYPGPCQRPAVLVRVLRFPGQTPQCRAVNVRP
jgi:hypothetical protein